MSRILIATIYFFFWICLAAALAMIGSSHGYSPWLMVGIAFLVFFFVNGSIAHYALSRRLIRENRQPPSYFEFLFQTDSFGIAALNKPIRAPSLVRILLGIVTVLVAILYIAGGSTMIFFHERPVEMYVGSFLLPLGIFSLYLGSRFFRKESSGRYLIGYRGLRIVSVVTILFSILVVIEAILYRQYWLAFCGLGGIWVAAMFYKASRMRGD
jgi:hypothetical protein